MLSCIAFFQTIVPRGPSWVISSMRPINRLPQIWVANKNTMNYSAKTLWQNCYCNNNTELSNNPLFWNQTQQLSYFKSKQDKIIDYPRIEFDLNCNAIMNCLFSKLLSQEDQVE